MWDIFQESTTSPVATTTWMSENRYRDVWLFQRSHSAVVPLYRHPRLSHHHGHGHVSGVSLRRVRPVHLHHSQRLQRRPQPLPRPLTPPGGGQGWGGGRKPIRTRAWGLSVTIVTLTLCVYRLASSSVDAVYLKSVSNKGNVRNWRVVEHWYYRVSRWGGIPTKRDFLGSFFSYFSTRVSKIWGRNCTRSYSKLWEKKTNFLHLQMFPEMS